MNRLSENIKLIRKQKWKLSQDRFAVLLGSSRSKINSYENSGVEPSISFMVKLQGLTGIPVANIYGSPIPIDSLPAEPMKEISPVNCMDTGSELRENKKYLSSFEEQIDSRFSDIENRLKNIELLSK